MSAALGAGPSLAGAALIAEYRLVDIGVTIPTVRRSETFIIVKPETVLRWHCLEHIARTLVLASAGAEPIRAATFNPTRALRESDAVPDHSRERRHLDGKASFFFLRFMQI